MLDGICGCVDEISERIDKCRSGTTARTREANENGGGIGEIGPFKSDSSRGEVTR